MKKEKDYIIDEFLGLNSEHKEKEIEKTQNDNSIISEEENPSIKVEKEQTLEETQIKILEEMKKENLLKNEINSTFLDPRHDNFITTVKDNVNFCVDELKEINEAMEKISTQKNSELFFKKSENIKLLSQYMSKMANVNQKTIDLLILLLGASGKISDNYETILATIDELGELNNGEAQVLNYLLKIKKMVYEIRDNEVKLKQVQQDNQITKEIVENANIALKKEIEESQKSRKKVESKCNRLQRKIAINNIYIGVSFILIILLAIFIGLKFYIL